MPGAANVFLVDPHAIYRRGLADCLRSLPNVSDVTEADSVRTARDDPAIAAADVVIVDNDLPRARDFVREVHESSSARVIVVLAEHRDGVVDVVASGAVGLLCKDTLTPDALAASVWAAISGTSVIAPELLVELCRDRAGASHDDAIDRRAQRPASLTMRERQVISLIAEGYPIREIAHRLCYSERTVKNVLHDVVTKLGARSRSQAVAHAVRDHLI
jgi:DNA-binding NarL/FixJ family response regulator